MKKQEAKETLRLELEAQETRRQAVVQAEANFDAGLCRISGWLQTVEQVTLTPAEQLMITPQIVTSQASVVGATAPTSEADGSLFENSTQCAGRGDSMSPTLSSAEGDIGDAEGLSETPAMLCTKENLEQLLAQLETVRLEEGKIIADLTAISRLTDVEGLLSEADPAGDRQRVAVLAQLRSRLATSRARLTGRIDHIKRLLDSTEALETRLVGLREFVTKTQKARDHLVYATTVMEDQESRTEMQLSLTRGDDINRQFEEAGRQLRRLIQLARSGETGTPMSPQLDVSLLEEELAELNAAWKLYVDS
ncbi:unnamed protein product [Protopolystoma xenopodis]|uniref:Uncharacterized protein n=1 Tax=Protopolystoma xenopodis TaxID=117903 RepID=A0A3S5C3W8_9PLAT|nr:unnamed protein product [Protopolystoma xenopodis]